MNTPTANQAHQDRKTVVQSHFDAYAVGNRWGELYDRANPRSHSFLSRREKSMELLGSLEGTRILDLGCGTGALVESLVGKNVEYIGVDNAPQMIEETTRHIRELGLSESFRAEVGTVDALRFPDGHFDRIVGMGLLEYFDRPETVIREALRVAKSGALLVFTIPRTGNLDDLLVRGSRPLRFAARRLLGRPQDPIAHDKYTDAAFRQLFLDLGCTFVGDRHYNKLPLPYPTTRFAPRVAFAAARWAEPRHGLRFLATGYIAAFRKP